MPAAYNGKILHVDLSDGRKWVEEPDELLYRKYLGGSAMASYFMLRDIPVGADPLGPENKLILMTSVTNGLPLSGCNRYTAAGKSPLTGGFGEAEAGGYWGPELKRTGFDGIIVHGQSETPVYLYISDGVCDIRDASKYWGKLAGEVQDSIIEDLGDKRARVLQTGIGGENLVKYAAIVNELRHFHGRAGLGAVMGSKKLKAIVVRGRERIGPENKDSAKEVLQWWRDNYDQEADGMHQFGTAGGVGGLDMDGILPTRNFRDGSFEEAQNITGQTMANTILVNRGTCYSCGVACKREVEVPERGVSAKYGGMEYEIIGALGSCCGVGDLGAVAEGSQLVNQYVLDGISAGVAIAWAMEAYENGVLTKADTDGIDLTFGNADAMLAMIHKIGKREGLGDLLADGVKVAAEKVGQGTEAYANHVKGQELPMHEPRGKTSVGLGYAISPTGADHMEAIHDPSFEAFGTYDEGFETLGMFEPVDRMALGPKKVHAFFVAQQVWSLYNCVGMCDFVGMPIGALKLEELRDYINAATGWNMSIYEMMQVGERANTLARIYNNREGFNTEDDTLPPRLFEGLQNGKLEGVAIDRGELADALNVYYDMCGWDAHGVPTVAKLAELGLDEVMVPA